MVNEQTATTALALNTVLPSEGSAPEWVELLPPGPVVRGEDGREWLNDQPQAVLNYFTVMKSHNRELPIDWEHAGELKAPKGDPAPAAGWGTQLEARDGGSIWAKISWTPRGLAAVANREYRHLSPVIIYHKATRRIVGISSVGLTNKPNLNLTALNRAGEPEEEPAMKKIYAALGLAETATETEALNAIETMRGDLTTANNRATSPNLERFVPRADYDQALNRASTAEQTVTDLKKAEMETAINTEIESALATGKITPATADYHKASCRQEGGLERFREYVKAAPAIGDSSGLDGKQLPGESMALNAEEAKVAAMFGNSVEDLKKYGNC